MAALTLEEMALCNGTINGDDMISKARMRKNRPLCPFDHPDTELIAVEGWEGIGQCPASGIYFKYGSVKEKKEKKVKIVNGKMVE
jgi:hypothetical protein